MDRCWTGDNLFGRAESILKCSRTNPIDKKLKLVKKTGLALFSPALTKQTDPGKEFTRKIRNGQV